MYMFIFLFQVCRSRGRKYFYWIAQQQTGEINVIRVQINDAECIWLACITTRSQEDSLGMEWIITKKTSIKQARENEWSR